MEDTEATAEAENDSPQRPLNVDAKALSNMADDKLKIAEDAARPLTVGDRAR